MTKAEELRQSFIGVNRETWTDKGIDYTNLNVDDLKPDPMPQESTSQERINLNTVEGGRVESAIDSSKSKGTPAREWWK